MENFDIKNKKEFLKAKIDLPNFKLEVESEDASRSLWDIRRIVECLYNEETLDEIPAIDDYLKFELRSQLSEELVSNDDAIKLLKNKIELGENYKIARTVIKGVKEIDLVKNTGGLKISNISITESVESLFKGIALNKVTDCIIHIKGCNDKEKNLLILDKINEIVPQVNLKALSSDVVLDGRIIIEAIIFGDF